MKDSQSIFYFYTKTEAALTPSLLLYIFSKKHWSLPTRNMHLFCPLPAAWLLEVQIVFPSICSICTGSSDLSIHFKCPGIGWSHVIIYFDFPQGHLDYYFFNYKITFKLNKQIMLGILQHKHNLSDSCCRGSSSLESALQNELAKHSPSPSNHPCALTSRQSSSPMSAFFNSYPQVLKYYIYVLLNSKLTVPTSFWKGNKMVQTPVTSCTPPPPGAHSSSAWTEAVSDTRNFPYC